MTEVKLQNRTSVTEVLVRIRLKDSDNYLSYPMLLFLARCRW